MLKNIKTSIKTYSRAQRVWSWVVLIGIFVCGIMAGAFIWESKTRYTADSAVQTDLSACEMREKALLANLYTDINDASLKYATEAHQHNSNIYKKLVRWGCAENTEKYKELEQAEFATFDVLNKIDDANLDNRRPCNIIETTLLANIIRDCGDSSDCHLQNAAVYSKIVEDGCSENQQQYARKALDELQIAEGVRINDAEVSDDEIFTTVNTYKKLQMQNEARKYIKKMEKLVNPGVEFIMELQRIIEE
jgi:hypothetical protein